MAHEVLIIDDEADIRILVSGILEDEGYHTRSASTGMEGLERIRERCPSLVVLDIWLGDSRYDGIKILELIKQETPQLPVLMISGHGTIETAVTAIKKGAYDFIEKPFKSERLLILVKRAIEAAALKQEVVSLKQRQIEGDELIGVSPFAAQISTFIKKNAPLNSRILIEGPIGSGKELLARTLHHQSQRDGNFIEISCSTLDPIQLEKELYGAEVRGERVSMGAFEAAHGGTLYLSNISEMPQSCQAGLTKVLHEQSFCRIGGERRISTSARVICSSSTGCLRAIASGKLKEDLYARIHVASIEIPALKMRSEDIPVLANYFTQRLKSIYNLKPMTLSEETILAMKRYSWPGNIRQLRNAIEWMIMMAAAAEKTILTLEMMPQEMLSSNVYLGSTDQTHEMLSLPLRESREVFEREYMKFQLIKFSGNISQIAQFIGMERSALHRKLKSLQLPNHSEFLKGSR